MAHNIVNKQKYICIMYFCYKSTNIFNLNLRLGLSLALCLKLFPYKVIICPSMQMANTLFSFGIAETQTKNKLLHSGKQKLMNTGNLTLTCLSTTIVLCNLFY